jgi:hypothetical protein
VVLLNGDLADPSAEELLGRIRARRPDCQICLLSGVSNDAEKGTFLT